jgi:lipid A 3-O-deacylase
MFLQLGPAEDSVHAASLGVALPLRWRSADYGATTHLELSASGWRAPRPDGGHRTLTQVSVVPMARGRFDDGRSPWFVEAGIGLALLDRELRTPRRRFSTRLNFSDNLGFGRSFGARGEQEISLRLQHVSNAGLRKPNPGLDLLLLRYAHSF